MALCLLAMLAAAIPAAGSELVSAGMPVERQIAGHESHRFGVAAITGSYAVVTVSQPEADLVATLRDPAGRILMEVDSPTGLGESEKLTFVAEATGIYQVEVQRLSAGTSPKLYRLAVETLRPATPEDRLRAAEATELARVDHALLQSTGEALTHAQEVYERALLQSRDEGDDARQAALLHRLGLLALRKGDGPEARRVFNEALALSRRQGDEQGAATFLHQLGRTHRRLGDLPSALAALSESLELWRKLGSPHGEASVSVNLGLLFHQSGELEKALDSYRRALVVSQQEEDRSLETVVLNNIGGIYDSLGRPVEALDYYQQALPLARSLDQPAIEAQILNNLGANYVRLGQLHEALESYTDALSLLRNLGEEHQQPPVLTNISNLLLELGAPETAREFLLTALDLLRNQSDRRTKAAILNNLGRAARQLGDFPEARARLDQALALQQEIGDRQGEAMTLLGQAGLEGADSQTGKALALLLKALELFRSLDDRAGEALTHRILGEVQATLADFPSARRSFHESLRNAEAIGNISEQAKALQGIAQIAREQGELASARGALERSIELLESLRLEISGEHLRTSHFATARAVYEMYIDVLMRLERPGATDVSSILAFETAERARARGLLDFLQQADVDFRDGDPDLLRKAERLRQQMNAKASGSRKSQSTETGAGGSELERELSVLEAEYQIVESRLQAESPRYARLKQPEIRLSQIQQESLESDTVLLEYFLAEPRSYLWIVTPESLASFELPGRERIEELVRRVHERLGRLDPTEASQEREDLKELSRLLLGPVLDRLKGKRVAVVADGALLYLPFPALPVPASDGSGAEVPLVVEHEVVHLPSAAVLRELRRSREERPRPPAVLAVLADPIFEKDDPRLQTVAQTSPPARSPEPPPSSLLASLVTRGGEGTFARLPWTRKEAEVIAAEAAGRDVLLALDVRASRDLALAEDLGRYRILHFATHGVLDTRRPALSGLVLSQVDERGQARDGFLRLHDIYHLRLNADLVVLSGCETALGKTLRGEGIIGLTRGFFHAGASQVMASLWPVRDRATAELMQRFYRGMFRDGLPASAALRQAQVSMWRERQWRDPYYWAAFVLQGDWRAGR